MVLYPSSRQCSVLSDKVYDFMHVDPNMFNHMSDYNHPSSLLMNVRRSKEV